MTNNNDNLKYIFVKGAKAHNLKNVSLRIPKNKLVIFTGLSGSGKSSLAFDTIYAEGQRRYIESLSTYARQFLGVEDKPDVELIEGLSPAISIDQKTKSNNPRSIVGTTTEIYDYLRLLFARIGRPDCPNGHGPIKSQTNSEIINKIYNYKIGTKIVILAPMIRKQKGTHQYDLDLLKKEGFYRVRVDGVETTLDQEINLERNKYHNIDIIVDRWIVSHDEDQKERLVHAIDVACEYSKGYVIVHNLDTKAETLFSKHHSCKVCGFSLPEMEPRLFSFNSPLGACEHCNGLGHILSVDDDLIVPNKELTIRQGAIQALGYSDSDNMEWNQLINLSKEYDIPLDIAYHKIPISKQNIIMYGTKEPVHWDFKYRNRRISKVEPFEGICNTIERRYYNTESRMAREYYSKFMREKTCSYCGGSRLNEKPLCVKINNKNIWDFCSLPISEAYEWFKSIKLTEEEKQISNLVVKEIESRLSFLVNVGLGYLELSRNSQSLSGGESQRIRLATQIGSKLTGVLYVLDEPSIGLHQYDNEKLIKTLKHMRDIGNTLIIVEHDEETMRESDYIVDIGPGAGSNGGEIIAQGTPTEIMNNKNSVTGKYLSGESEISIPKTRRGGNGKVIKVVKASENNLKNITVTFPLNKMIVVTGLSGSGKSTLINNILYRGVKKGLGLLTEKPGKHDNITGLENIDKVIFISQDPIGRTPRSNPATYTSVFDDIRKLFAETPDAKAQGFTASRFSFNVDGGRCEKCHGDGVIKISMHFLPDVHVKCDECQGQRFNSQTLKIKYKNKNIFDILEMTVDEAVIFFENIPKIFKKLKVIQEVGLGYIKLGQSAPQLSGGEAQRIKIASYLLKKPTGKTLYLLDEPTTGLHFEDIKKLLSIMNRILTHGDSIILIEHNLDIIKSADYIIDLGPEGGKFGGNVIATGTPEQVANNKASITGEFLKKILSNKS